MNKPVFINLTPHPITVSTNGGSFVRVYPPSGQVARVSSSHSQFDENGVEVVRMSDVEIEKFKQVTMQVYDMYKDYFTKGLVDKLKAA